MTSEIFLLYVLTRLNTIGVIAGIGTLVSLLLVMGCALNYAIDADMRGKDSADANCSKNLLKKVRWLWVPFVIALIITPSKEDAMFIVAGTGVIEAAKSDTAQRIAGKSVKVIENYLDKLSETKK